MLDRHRHDSVLVLRFDDPERRNALGYAQVAELVAALREADADPAVRCVVLTGSGSAFSAGGDLRQFRAELGASAVEHWDSGADWEALCTLVPRLRVPVVAAVNGPALAGGCGVVALADVALASAEATFGLTEIRIGLFPIVVLPAVRRAVGDRAARRLALTGAVIDATEAHRLGLVSEVVAPADLAGRALEVARELAALAPVPMALGKRLLADTADLSYDAAVAHARAVRGVFLSTGDLAEGVDAFLGKRSPVWPGAGAPAAGTGSVSATTGGGDAR